MPHFMVLKFEHQNHSEGLFKPRAGLCPRDSASAVLGWGLIICLSRSKFSGDAAAAGPGTALRIKARDWRKACMRVLPFVCRTTCVWLCCISSGYDIVGTFQRVKLDAVRKEGVSRPGHWPIPRLGTAHRPHLMQNYALRLNSVGLTLLLSAALAMLLRPR